jgi:hypothetical protein
MALLARCLKTFGVLVGVLLACVAMAVWSQRISLLYLAMLASVALPVAYWRRAQAWRLTDVFFALVFLCAFSPVDLVFYRRAKPGVQVLPVHYGHTCVPDAVCPGCAVPRNAPRYEVIVSLPK